MVGVKLVNVSKVFGKAKAVDNVSFEVRDKEFFTLLGPSGCGKTTTLRIIAGLLEPDEGEVYYGDRLMNSVPPEKRNVTMVFQNFALFPHMTVYDNIAFGLKMRGWSKSDIERRVKEVVEMLRIEGLENKYPHQLSGGQQQRVGLARALAPQPEIILFDEPLSNLDAILREQIRFELRELVKKVGITSIYVTHDQAEALVVSDRMAIMRSGRIVQMGSPREIYEKPNSVFVAKFLGVATLVEGSVESGAEGEYVFSPAGSGVVIRVAHSFVKPPGQGILVLRPEYINVEPAGRAEGEESGEEANVFEGTVEKVTFLGSTVDMNVRVDNMVLRTFIKTTEMEPYEGMKVIVRLEAGKLVVVPPGE